MTKIARAVLAAIALTGPTLAVADGKPASSSSKPSSYAPGPHTDRHIYGAPIDPPIVGHAVASHRTHARTQPSTGTAPRNAHASRAHHGAAKAPAKSSGSEPNPR